MATNPNYPQPKTVTELRSLNKNEQAIIIAGLELLACNSQTLSGGAKILLEDDAEFVRGLFWTSKKD